MGLDIYWTTLLLLVPTVTLLTGRNLLARPFRRFAAAWKDGGKHGEHTSYEDDLDDKDAEAHRFRRIFLQVYLLVMGSEWLQGPYMYTLLRDEKSLSETTIATLYSASYIAAAVSALFVGFLADRYGRRNACLASCLLHSLSSLTVVSSSLAVIFLGRILAGVTLTLVWTVFESWMVTEFNARRLASPSVTLSTMFGTMTTSSCMSAVLGGVLGHCIVLALRSRANPVLAGIVLEAIAAYLMLRDWNENYGEATDASVDDNDQEPRASDGQGRISDIRVWMLSFISCFFEGTNFLVLFFWPSMLQDAHRRVDPDSEGDVPYGVVFAAFMATMILGSLLFNVLAREGAGSSALARLRRVVRPNWLLAAAVLVAGVSLIMLSVLKSELAMFRMFLLFEACNGIYLPSIAYQRGIIVDQGNRTGMYGLMKIPLFLFVIGSLNMTASDDRLKRIALLVGAVMLLLAAICAMFLRAGPKHEKLINTDGLEIHLDDAIDEKEVEGLVDSDDDDDDEEE